MSAAAIASGSGSGRSSRSDGSIWLFGPGIDIAFGCGGLYLVLFSLMAGGAFGIPTGVHELLAPALILLFSLPHYGATLLRVYERREDRQRYHFFAVWGAVLVYGLYFVGLNVPVVGAWFLTLYLTWSPWHYSGQNFGIAMTFLRRAGVPVDARTRRLLQLSFTLSFVVVFLASHGGFGRQADYAVSNRYAGNFEFLSLGLPAAITDVAMPLCLLGIVLCLGGVALGLRGKVDLRAAVPTALIVVLQTVWMTVPFALGHYRISTGIPFIDLVTRSTLFTYIAVAHSCQYLWVTSFFARKSSTWSNQGVYWLKAMAFGHAVVLVPTVLAVATPLAGVSFDAGPAVLVIAALNLHHFILDGAIWKLRSGPIANILLRDQPPEGAPLAVAQRRPWRRPLAVGVLALFLATASLQAGNRILGVEDGLRKGDPERASAALDRLAWLAQESSADRMRIGDAFVALGRTEDAEREFARSVALRATPAALLKLAQTRAARGNPAGALDAYDEALELEPRWVPAMEGGGLMAYHAGMYEEAVRRLRPLFAAGHASADARAAYLASRRALQERAAGGVPDG